MPYTVSAEGNVLYNWLALIAITPIAVAANTTAEQSFAVPGLLPGDYVGVYANGAQTAGIGIVNNRVSAANTLQIGFSNSTSGSLTPVAGQYYLNIMRPESFQNLPNTAAS